MPFKFRTGEQITSKDLLGIEEDELKNSLNAGKEASTKVTQLEEKVATGFQEVKELLARAAGAGRQQSSEVQHQQQDDGIQDDGIDPATKIALGATKMAMESRMDIVKSQVRDMTDTDGNYLYPYWDTLIGDINKLTEKDPLSVKVNIGYWQNAYKICFADKHKELTEKGKGRQRFTSEPATRSATEITNDGKTKPTPTDEEQAKKWGIPLEKYMESKQTLRFVN